MPLSNLLVLLGVFGFVLILFLFPSFRGKLKVLLGGFLNVFVEDTAKTPEGAAAIYSKAIEEAQEKYNKAHDTLKSLTGRLEHVQQQRDTASEEVKSFEDKARRALQHGREEDARIYAEKRQDSLLAWKQYSKTYEQLLPAVNQAKAIYIQRQKDLNEISRKKKLVVEQLKTNRDVEEAFDDLDELRRDSSTKQLLGAIDEECAAGSERAAGARIVHEAKLSTRVSRADEKSSSDAVDDFLDSLRSPQLSQHTSKPSITIVTPQKTSANK